MRSLAAFRVGLGVLILVDLASRASHWGALYSDEGALPLLILPPRTTPFFAYLLSGSTTASFAVATLAALSAVCLAMGLWTRAATCMSWFLIGSLHARNPYVVDFGDIILRTFLFWAMFLPLGSTWSVDAHRARSCVPSPKFASTTSFATSAPIVQFALIYGSAALIKSCASPDWVDGTAIRNILHIDYWVTDLGVRVREFPTVTRGLTWGVLAYEYLLPLLIFSPWKTALCRAAAFVSVCLFHAALSLHIRLGAFPLVCIVSAIPLLPGSFWDRLAPTSSVHDRATAPRPSTRGRFVDRSVVAGALAYVVLSNVAAIASFGLPRLVDRIGGALKLKQTWGMYAGDTANQRDGSYRIVATRSDGVSIDLNRGGAPVSTPHAARLSATHESFRWGSYVEAASESPELTQPMLRWQCRRWNASHQANERVVDVEFEFLEEQDPNQKQKLGRVTCDSS